MNLKEAFESTLEKKMVVISCFGADLTQELLWLLLHKN
jgi:hypothetical protein